MSIGGCRCFWIVEFMTRVMMKLSKGLKVEVLCKEEFSWRLGEIIFVSRRSCLIRYDSYPGTRGEMVVEKVSRKAVRPMPPPVVPVDGFDVGDLVEVFDKNSWKACTLLRVTSRNDYDVRLLGSCKELTAGRCRIRVRQSWQGQGWSILRKVIVKPNISLLISVVPHMHVKVTFSASFWTIICTHFISTSS